MLLRASAVGIAASTLLPWYRAYSGQALCARLLRRYIDVSKQDPVLLTRGSCKLRDGVVVDLWVFRERAAVLVGLGMIALLIASTPPAGAPASRRARLRRMLVMTVAVGSFLTVAGIMLDQPGFGDEIGDLYFLRWGGWFALACGVGILIGGVLMDAGYRARRPDRRA